MPEPSRRRKPGPWTIAAGVLLAATLVLIVQMSRERVLVDQQFLGPLAAVPVAKLKPADTACEVNVGLAQDTDRVVLATSDTKGVPGPPMRVFLRESASGRELAAQDIGPGHLGGNLYAQFPKPVPADTLVDVCVANTGERSVTLLGDTPAHLRATTGNGVDPAPESRAVLDETPVQGDLFLAVPQVKPVGALRALPQIFVHASAFLPAPMGAWTFWLLGAVGFLVAPILLLAALRGTLTAAEPPATAEDHAAD